LVWAVALVWAGALVWAVALVWAALAGGARARASGTALIAAAAVANVDLISRRGTRPVEFAGEQVPAGGLVVAAVGADFVRSYAKPSTCRVIRPARPISPSHLTRR